MATPPTPSSTSASAIKIAARSTPVTFKKALNRLATDNTFRAAAVANPSKLTNTFDLSLKELHALRQAAILSGANMAQINRARAVEIGRLGPAAVDDINVSCCCCCCCGETGVMLAHG